MFTGRKNELLESSCAGQGAMTEKFLVIDRSDSVALTLFTEFCLDCSIQDFLRLTQISQVVALPAVAVI